MGDGEPPQRRRNPERGARATRPQETEGGEPEEQPPRDTGATVSCQPDGVGILQETVSNAVMMIQGATARDPTASKAGGVSIFFLPSAQRADTAYALGVWRVVLPTLSCIVDSPHARSIHGVRQCTDDTKLPPYMTIVPSGTPLNPDVHESNPSHSS